MKFEWDATKNSRNIRKHGFSFEDAAAMFREPLLVRADVRDDYAEKRWTGIGMIQGRFALVVFVELDGETIRFISLRKATHEERQEYEEALRHGLEAG